MNFLRTLCIGDVVRALKRHEPLVALRVSGNLIGNAVSAARTRLPRRSQLPVRRIVRSGP